jgi:PAS domain S-box-containing protein
VSERVRVLVVDDSEFFGTLVAGELERLYDMETTRTSSSEKALTYLERGNFECIISDYDMPETDGIEFFEAVRDRGFDVPFFLLTAAGSEEVASRAITAGIDDYFPKTKGEDQFEILGKRVQNVVSKRRAARSLERRRRLNETLWRITQELIHAPTRDEIGDRVCDQLVDFDRIAFAWLDTHDSETVGHAGIEAAALDEFRTQIQDTELAPTETALREQTIETATVTVNPDADSSTDETTTTETDSETELVAIPLLYQETAYGVVTVATAEGHSIESSDRDALGHLGTTVGHALAAVEMEREVEIFREAVDQADPAIAITDTAGRIDYVNSAFEAITGYGAGQLYGESITLLATERYDSDDYTALLDRVQDGETVREEVVQRRADGAQFYADLSVAPITVENTIEQFVLVESDITELKSREQRLQVLNRVLRHNLRNDLNAIKGYLSLLLDELDDEHLSYAERAHRKVDSLLTVSEKAEFVNKMVGAADEQSSHPTVQVTELLGQEIEQVRKQYPSADLSLDADQGLETRGTNLEAAIHELLVNSIEHNDADTPQVTVTATTETAPDGIVHVEIADDGPGIPEVERETLASGMETDLQHGSSLGLWLVHWIVTFVGGELSIEKADESGSTVRISLPNASSS